MKKNLLTGLIAAILVALLAVVPAEAAVPATSIDSGPNTATVSTDATFEFSSDEPGATFECRLDPVDDQGWAACESPLPYTGLAAGGHEFQVRATDLELHTGAVASHSWTIDIVAPTVTIDRAPTVLSGSIHATFEFSADESGATAECRLDPVEGAAWTTCESPDTYTDLIDGDHRFEVRVTDAAGNQSEPATHDWTIETVKPEATITSGPDLLTSETEADIEFSSENATATFECRLDPAAEAAWEPCVSPAVYTGVSDGEHVFEVRAIDSDAGTGPVASFAWAVDTVAPLAVITVSPPPISGNTDPRFEFRTNETGTTAECRLDPVDELTEWIACVMPVQYTGLAEGDRRFEVRVTDRLGHLSEPATYSWTVETTPPTATITTGPSGVTAEISAWFGFTSENDTASFECRLDPDGAGGWTACVSGVEYSNLADGEHEFEVRAVGQGAGPGPVASRSWTVDTVSPAVIIASGPNQPTNETVATFELAVNKPGFTFECQIDAEPAVACTSPATYADLVPGEHSFVVEAVDSEGIAVDSALWQWTILAEAPVATVTNGPPSVSSSDTAVFHLTGNVPEATFECRIDDAGSWDLCNSPAGYTGLVDGPHSFDVRAVLAGSVAGQPARREWTVDTTAPALTVTGGPSGVTGSTEASFEIVSDDADANVECRLDGAAWTVCGSRAQLTGLADGPHTLRVRAVDSVGNTGLARRDWSVDSTAPATTIGTDPGLESTAFDARFTFTADETGSSFECQLDGSEWKDCSSGHQLRDLRRGEHKFAVRATDALGNVGPTVTHEWRIVAPALKGLAPKINFTRKVKLDRDGTALLARIICPEGRCRVIAPKRVSFRLKGKRFTPGIKSPRGWYKERSNEIMLITSAGTRRVVRNHGPAKIRVKLTVESDNGKRRSATVVVVLTAGR